MKAVSPQVRRDIRWSSHRAGRYGRAMVEIERFTDPRAVLAAAGDLLAAEPVLTTVTSTVTHGAVGSPAPAAHPRWWLVVRVEGEVVGIVMRTAPFAPYPVYTTPLPDDAARAVGEWLVRHASDVRIVGGGLPAAETIAGVLAEAAGVQVEGSERLRLFDLPALVLPPAAPGGRRLATASDLDLCTAWLARFDGEAAEQAGRSHHGEGELSRTEVARRIEEQRTWLWEVDGVPVHLTSFNHPALGVARIGPVYTPREHRGHGYAASCVAAVSDDLLALGARVCLFADADNPVSTGVYVRLGYRPLALTGRFELGPITR